MTILLVINIMSCSLQGQEHVKLKTPKISIQLYVTYDRNGPKGQIERTFDCTVHST